MERRTHVEEMRFNQALGYAWGMQDGSGYRVIIDSWAFASWYSVVGHGVGTIADSLKEFVKNAPDEQMLIGEKYRRAPGINV
jgi:hypothetical protein